MEDKILEWERLTNSITEDWIVKYFELSEEDVASGIDYFWVADDVGGIFEFADMYFNFSNVLDCYKYKITKDQLFGWYDFCLSNQFVNISLARFILSPEERTKQEQESIEKSKKDLEYVGEIFKQAIADYENRKTK